MRASFFLFLPLVSAACAGPVTDTAPSELVRTLASPCGELPVEALLALPDGTAWVGCSHSRGVFRTLDSGASFEAMHASPRLRVNQLVADREGRVLLCGRDLASRGRDAVLLRHDRSRGWSTLRSEDPGSAESCGRVAVAPGGALAEVGTLGGGVHLRPNDSSGWLEPGSWYVGSGPEPRLWDLASGGDCWSGLGADLTGPPRFLLPATSEDCLPWRDVVVDSELVGELWTLASPDGGASWLAGGRDLGDEPYSRGVVYRSRDGGERWRPLDLPSELAWVRGIGFSPSGACGVAVGHRSGPTGGGFVLVSLDAGASWWELDQDLPALRVVSVLEQGFLVGGEGGFVGVGRCG